MWRLPLLLLCELVKSQYVPNSPCPDVFSYESDGMETYGVIRYRHVSGLSSLTLKANFSVRAVLSSNYVGRLEVVGEKQGVLQAVLRGQPLLYRVHFPVTTPLPRLTALAVNDHVICYGDADFARPGEAVTTISLNHMLFAEDTSRPVYVDQPINQQKPTFAGSKPTFTVSKPTFTGSNPTIYIDGQPIEINNNNFNIIESNEPSYSINTITVPNRHTGTGSNSFFPPQSSQPQPQPPQQFPQQPQTQPPPQLFPQQPQPPQQFPQQPQPPQQFPQQPQPQTPPPQQPQPQPQVPQKPTQQSPRPPPPPPATPPADDNSDCGVVSGGNERVPLVFQGQSVSRGDWPWLTALYVKKGSSVQYICTGSLVSDTFVVTAAHCMHEKSSLLSRSLFIVKTGAFNLDSWSDAVIRGLSEAVVHPGFNPATLEHDILLMKLDSAVQFTNFNKPVCLWEGATDASFIAGQYGSVVGWGLNEIRGSGQGEPRMATVPIVTTDTCRASRIEFHKLTSKNTICAGDRNGTGPCNGDSGGGLYILWGGRWRLRGVVSVSLRPVTGEARCNLNEYVVFTDVAQYLPWLQQNMAT